MIISFGDSHSFNTFRSLSDDAIAKKQSPGLTMHKVGRDGLHYHNYMNNRDTIIYCCGEIDVRCHIKKQILLNREKEEIINTLAKNYVNAILNRDKKDKHKKINITRIIMSVVPPCIFKTIKDNPDYPCIGTDEERAEYTLLLNKELEDLCAINNIMFFNIYPFYADQNGSMRTDMSKDGVHISNCDPVVEYLKSLKFI